MNKKLLINSTCFKDLFIIRPNSFKDERGSFSRVFCYKELNDIFNLNIKEINHSFTKERGTVRGMHFQYEPDAEVKMVKCIRGSVLDVLVDIRKDSPTFLQTFSVELSEKNQKMVYIPKGLAHGFQTLENNTELLYLHSNNYTPSNEGGLNARDDLLNIKWPLKIVNLSKRDKTHPFLTNEFVGVNINEM
jgi:dTDP-4-dehydrorhamnose 3,5-epimerase|tara:strand:- start:772 stop:1341 length:570 start_codon:yes stop_codon:yes gene_type:complete